MFSWTKHGSIRASQRNIKEHDVEIIMTWGSEVCDGYFMRERDCQAAARASKKTGERTRQLKGMRVVVKDGKIVTVYRAREAESRRILRRTEERCLEQAA